MSDRNETLPTDVESALEMMRFGCPFIKDGVADYDVQYFERRMLKAAEILERASRHSDAASVVVPREPSGFYLQDTRSFIGNDMLWWAKDKNGYTTDLRKAHVFTKEEADAQESKRDSDVAWPVAYIQSISRPCVDFQYAKRLEADAMLSAAPEQNAAPQDTSNDLRLPHRDDPATWPAGAAPGGEAGLVERLTREQIEEFRKSGIAGLSAGILGYRERFDTLCDMALRSLDAGWVSGWQPIETAPRDGTWILVCGGNTVDDAGERRPAVAQYTNDLNGGKTDWHWQFAWYDGGYYGFYDEPTHWRPLPEAPVTSAKP